MDRAIAMVCLLVIAARACAAPVAPRPTPVEVRTLENSLRSLLLKNLPDPLVKIERDWGRQKAFPRGMKNDGAWRRLSIRVPNANQSLQIGITESTFPEPGRVAFTAMIGADCDLKFEQQRWRRGVRIYSGETRGRCHAAMLLKCEATSRTETLPGRVIPDLVFRVKVTEAKLFYEKLVIEHTAGIGGDAAKLLGDAVIDMVRQAKPGLERDLLKKANAAIVKAADTKEIRVSLEAFLKGASVITKGK